MTIAGKRDERIDGSERQKDGLRRGKRGVAPAEEMRGDVGGGGRDQRRVKGVNKRSRKRRTVGCQRGGGNRRRHRY